MAPVRDYGGQKRLCRLYNVRKLYLPSILSYRAKFARDRFARCDTFQELCADGFFHDEYYADLSQTCSRVRMRREARASTKLHLALIIHPLSVGAKWRLLIASLGHRPRNSNWRLNKR
jgi:hypothetical protein